ncbi:MAG: hypothetical protein CMQ49_14385 [Gammaproteobacteria bacterium]|nr:hypothetical protein [Gammaproteobacteria bacterium]
MTNSTNIAILYWADPFGYVPSGIDSFIRGILKFAPPDLSYTVVGATSDPVSRPLGKEVVKEVNGRELRLRPVVTIDPSSSRTRIPMTLRYMHALRREYRQGRLDEFAILDFHRIEPALLFLREPRPRNLTLHHDNLVSTRSAGSDNMWRFAPWLYDLVERPVLPRMDRVFCVRQSAVDRYLATDERLAGKVMFTPTWMEPDVFNAGDDVESDHAAVRQQLGVASDTALITTVGRIDHQKDPLLLISAFAKVSEQHPRCQLVLIGDGTLRAQVSDKAAETGCSEKVTFMGSQPPEEIARVLRASDIFALSSAYEGMPIALLESLACGLPAAVTDVGEVRRVVEHGVNGMISADRSVDAYAACLGEGLARAEELRGSKCTDAVVPYRPERVLAAIYENHRRQAQRPG